MGPQADSCRAGRPRGTGAGTRLCKHFADLLPCLQVYLTMAVALCLSAVGVYASVLTGFGQGTPQHLPGCRCSAARCRTLFGCAWLCLALWRPPALHVPSPPPPVPASEALPSLFMPPGPSPQAWA